VPCQATRRAGRATPGFALQKRNLHTTVSAGFRRLFDVSFDRALSSNPVKCCSKATDFGSSQAHGSLSSARARQ
jgi:hypothetical protein